EVQGSYMKAPGEDLRAMKEGITGYKGKIHIQVGHEIREAVEEARRLAAKNEQAQFLAGAVDRQIQTQYRLFGTNYLAYDEIEGKGTSGGVYTEKERKAFLTRLDEGLVRLGESPEVSSALRRRVFEMYANPVRNSRQW